VEWHRRVGAPTGACVEQKFLSHARAPRNC
jgi:hypothetical protein